MTRKDYQLIAAVFQKANETLTGTGTDRETIIATIADDIADVLATDNPRFDRARFLKACGLGE